ncbi:MAG: hypothetical protein ABSF22_14265 [Bryobacteraceae bacterium]
MFKKNDVPFPDKKTFEMFISSVLNGMPPTELKRLRKFQQPLVTIGISCSSDDDILMVSSAVNFFEATDVHGDRLTKLFPGVEGVPPGSILIEVGVWEADDVFNASWRGAVQGIAA